MAFLKELAIGNDEEHQKNEFGAVSYLSRASKFGDRFSVTMLISRSRRFGNEMKDLKKCVLERFFDKNHVSHQTTHSTISALASFLHRLSQS